MQRTNKKLLITGIANKKFRSPWNRRKKILINHNKVTGNLVDYPMLINISSDSSLAEYARTDGYDIMFCQSDGMTKLNHEIESWDKATGKLVAWVKIPSLIASDDSFIYMYYGNPTSLDQSNKTGVWDSNYMMVHHLSESTGHHLDSTSNTNNTSNETGATRNAAGVANGADSLDGTSAFITVPNSATIVPTNSLTIEFWYKLNNIPSVAEHEMGISRLVHNSSPWHSFNFYIPVDDIPVFHFPEADDTWRGVQFKTAVTSGVWRYIAVTRNPSSNPRVVGYQQGQNDVDWIADDGSEGFLAANSVLNLFINASNTKVLNGIADEFRISNVDRSPSYFSTSYNNISDPSTFYSIGSQESR